MKFENHQLSRFSLLLQDEPKYRSKIFEEILTLSLEDGNDEYACAAWNLRQCGATASEMADTFVHRGIPLSDTIGALSTGYQATLNMIVQTLVGKPYIGLTVLVAALKANRFTLGQIMASLENKDAGNLKPSNIVAEVIHGYESSLTGVIMVYLGNDILLKDVVLILKLGTEATGVEILKALEAANQAREDILTAMEDCDYKKQEILYALWKLGNVNPLTIAVIAKQRGYTLEETYDTLFNNGYIGDDRRGAVTVLYLPEGYDASEEDLIDLLKKNGMDGADEVRKMIKEIMYARKLPSRITEEIQKIATEN